MKSIFFRLAPLILSALLFGGCEFLGPEVEQTNGDYDWARGCLNEAITDLNLRDPLIIDYYSQYLDANGSYSREIATGGWLFELLMETTDEDAFFSTRYRLIELQIDRNGDYLIIRDYVYGRLFHRFTGVTEPSSEQIAAFIGFASDCYRRVSGKTDDVFYSVSCTGDETTRIDLYSIGFDRIAYAEFSLVSERMTEFFFYE
ncbi:MAG: hypothetical protein GF399_09745 [Candidatus Coatesbacteria bacterium]|nr:hypothetical protein [Candidatus Coatesbacteria bacterium]